MAVGYYVVIQSLLNINRSLLTVGSSIGSTAKAETRIKKSGSITVEHVWPGLPQWLMSSVKLAWFPVWTNLSEEKMFPPMFPSKGNNRTPLKGIKFLHQELAQSDCLWRIDRLSTDLWQPDIHAYGALVFHQNLCHIYFIHIYISSCTNLVYIDNAGPSLPAFKLYSTWKVQLLYFRKINWGRLCFQPELCVWEDQIHDICFWNWAFTAAWSLNLSRTCMDCFNRI